MKFFYFSIFISKLIKNIFSYLNVLDYLIKYNCVHICRLKSNIRDISYGFIENMKNLS